MAGKITLVVCLIFCCQISCVTAASECTGAILASVFGTIGTLLVIAAIAALVWYCCRKKSGTLSSGSSVDSASEPELSLGTKTKGGDIGLNGHGTPVTFSHRYSEEAPSAAYNTKGVVNPAFGGSREVLIDMPPRHEGDVKIDMDGSPSVRPPSHKGDVKIDMGGHPVINPPSSKGDVKLDMDWDPSLDTNLTDGNPPDLTIPEGKPPGVDLPESKLSASGLSGGSLPGADADVIIQRPAKPTFNVDGPKNMETIDVDLDRPDHGGFGLLIARDKNLPPPALFVREVTPGGIAAKTGLIDKGDKIIGINGVPIEGMPYDRAMSLLRDDEKPKLQLTLLKNALYKGKDASLDLPEGSVEESCKIDMEPTLEAGVPSVDIEGLQGDASDLGEIDVSAEKPEFDVSGPQVDTPEVKLKTQVSGPNVYSNIDLNDPSSDLNLHSPKTKRGKCFSCASSGDKDEPYSKGKANAGLDLDRPNVDGSIDMKTGGKIGVGSGPDEKGLGLRAIGPNVSAPSTSTSGNMSGPSVEGENIEMNPKVQLHSNSAGIKTTEGNLRTQMSGPDVDVSVSKLEGPERKAGIPSAELDLPIKKKKRGNWFSCAGGTDKEDPYKKGKGNVAIDFNRPDADRSMEMRAGENFDITGTHNNLGGDTENFQPKELGLLASAPDVDIRKSDQQRNIEISGPNVSLPSPHVSAKVPERSLDGESINAPHTDTPGEKMKTEISGLDVDVPVKIPGRRAQVDVPSAELDVAPTKKKRSSCFSCAGDGDKDDSYRTTKGNVGYDFSGPDGSLELKKVDKFEISGSGPDFEEDGKTKELGPRAAGPDFELKGENKGISPGTSQIAVTTRGPVINAPDVSKPSGKTNMGVSETSLNKDVDIDVSGPDASISRKQPEVDFHTNASNIDTPEAKLRTQMSGPDVEVSTGKIKDPKAKSDVPSAELNLSSSKKKRGNCLSCTGGADKDEPYRKTKGDAQFGLNRPEVQGSTEVVKAGNFDIHSSDQDMTIKGKGHQEDFTLSAAAPDVRADAALPRQSTSLPSSGGDGKISGGNIDITADGSGLDVETEKPNVGFDTNAPEFKKKSKIQAETSRPDVDVPSGNIRGPKANIHGPSTDLHPPSRTKPRGNCLSCKGDAAKDEPYKRAKGSTQFDFDGQDVDASLELAKPAITKPNAASGGRATGTDFDLDTPDIDVSTQKPKSGLKSPEFDVPKATGTRELDLEGPAFSYDKQIMSEPSLRKTNEDIDIPGSNRGINTPDIDAAVNTPDTGFKSLEFGLPNLGASAEIDARPNANVPDFNKAKGKLQAEVSRADVDVSSGNGRGPDANLQGPSADLHPASKRKPRGNCLSCTGGVDKDEPYKRAKGNTQYDFDGPDLDGSVEMKKSGVREPKVDIDGGASGPEFHINTPDIDILSKKAEIGLISAGVDAPKGGSSGKMGINGPDFSYEKPKVSGPSLDKTEEYVDIPKPDFSLNSPEIDTTNKPNIGFHPPGLDVPKTKGAGEIDLNGAKFSYEKPNISGPSIGQRDQEKDTPMPDLDIDTPQSLGDFDIPKPEISVPSKGGDITLTSSSCEDLDVEANLPDIEVSNSKPRFGLDTNGLDIDIPGVENNLEVVEPSVSTLHADTSASKPTIGLDMNGLDVYQTGDVDFDFNRPDLDVTSKQRYGEDITGLDTPDSDYRLPSINKKEQSFEPLEIKDHKGKDFDAKFDWGINTSTPKTPEANKQLKGLPRGEINLETSPVEGDISVVNTYDTLELHSTPQPLPSASFDEPHSLQRYDEIRPEMELRLLSPREVNKSDQSFEFDIPDTSHDKAKDSWKPGSMKLVKVEENVTVCSASIEENESLSPSNRKLTLDREIKQKIEVVFPEEEKQKRSTSSSSSSSSDSDGQKENRPKRKKKSRLLKAFRKSSSSSTSSKEGRKSLKQKEKEPKPSARSSSSDDEEGERKKSPLKGDVAPSSREGHAPLKQDNRKSKQSTSSSSSDEEDVERRKRPSKDDVLLVTTTEDKKTRTSSTSSSSDEAPSFLHGKGLPKRKNSKSSSSSSPSDKENHDGGKQLLLEQTTFEEKEPEESVLIIKTVQEDMPMVVSHSVKPVSDLVFVVDKPDGDIKPEERRSSTSSSSDEESKSSMVYKVEYSMYQQQYVVEPESEHDKPVLSVADMQEDAPEVALNSVKPADPDFLFMSDMQAKPKERKSSTSSSSSSDAEDVLTVDSSSVIPISPDLPFLVEKPDDEIKPKEQKSSSSSSSDEESKSPVAYEGEDSMLQQQPVLEPKSGRENPVLSATDMQEGAPEDVLHSVEPKDPEFKFTLDAQTKPKGRKSSTSSSSSSDSVKPVDPDLSLLVEKPADEIKPKERKSSTSSSSDGESRSPVVYKVEFTTYQQQYPAEPEGESDQPVPSVAEVQEDSPEVESHSLNPTDPDFIFMPDAQTKPKERKSSTSSSSSSDAEPSNDNKDPETSDVHDPKAVVDTSLPQKYFVSYDIKEPDYPQKTEKQLLPERKSSTSSSSSEEIDDSSHTLDVTVYRYETVHHVIASDNPSTEQETNSSDMQENSFVVVSRSFKRPPPDIWNTARENQDEPQVFLSSTDVQFSEPPTDLTYHLEYPFSRPEVEEDKSAHIQEERIVPVFKSPPVDHDMSDVSDQLESPDEDRAVDRNSGTSPTWNIHAHAFETVYHITIPDSPATDGDSLEIQELAPTVVTRSVKRTSPVIISEYDNLEVEPQFSTSSTEVQFSEPSNDFQIEYPKNGKVLTTDEPDVTLTDEEWIMKHTVEKETPDISALLAVFDLPKEEAQQSSDSRDKTEDEEKSPRENSPKDIVRRGSNSRLWDLMQGYLIEQPILNDGTANSEFKPEKSVQKEDPKLETTEPVPSPTVESSVPVLNQQTETVHQVTQQASNIVTYKILLDDKEPSKELTTSITKTERSVSEVTPKASKFDPVTFQVNVGDKTPVVKEHTTSHWRKQISVPVDIDDKDEDPWMRHYSKGLQRATSYQVVSTKSPESQTSFAQSRGLSLSKVPHVKGIKTSSEKERERTRYSIESRTRTEPTVYRVTTERRPLSRELEAVPRVRTNENVFSIKDGKTQSPKSQTRTTREEPPRGASGSGPSIQSLRSLWDK